MSHRFVRCPHCKMPHDAAERVCPVTGRKLEPPPSRTRVDAPEPHYDPRRVPSMRLPSPRSGGLDLVGTTVSGRYLVRGVLGEGGMGTVYDAEHVGLGRFVAVKVLNPTQAKKRVAVKRFQQEARAAGAIGHPNICEVYDMGLLDDGSPYLVMEKLVGQTLADRIAREGGLPFEDLVEIMVQVLSGLIAAHEKGIVHRDIKPENIFLARRVGCPPIVKILDFGVSKMMPQFAGGDEQLDLTRTGMVMGTPYYMSPEQARGERMLDGRVDVYACGVMMYEALVGKRPFLAPNYNALLLAIINTSPRPLREIRPATPPALEAIVGRAMAKSRSDRYPSANHLLRDLQTLPLARGSAVRVPPPPTAEERARAPVVGGSPRRDAFGRADSAGAALRRRMTQGNAGPTNIVYKYDDPDPEDSQAYATRVDVRAKKRQTPPPPSDSVDVPMDFANTETPIVERGLADLAPRDGFDEMPTEVFRPGLHPMPRPQPASASPAQQPPPARREPPRLLPSVAAEDWEGETVVRQPRPTPAKKPLPIEETVAIDPSASRRRPR